MKTISPLCRSISTVRPLLLGAGVGASLGVALHSFPVGVAFGAAFALVLAIAARAKSH